MSWAPGSRGERLAELCEAVLADADPVELRSQYLDDLRQQPGVIQVAELDTGAVLTIRRLDLGGD